MSRQIADFSANTAGVRAGEYYGIEVEAEGLQVPVDAPGMWNATFRRFWRTTTDGSLRNNGVEFVSKPLSAQNVEPAVKSLWVYRDEGRFHESVRTGIHIHASCLGLNTDDVRRILTHYALVEPQLFEFVGAHREENIYCIPWYRAPREASRATSYLDRQGLQYLDDEATPCKYSALFVAPLASFGTIEFRHAPTFVDQVSMMHWWLLCQAVWRTHATTYDVLARWRELGPVGFSASIFPFGWLPPAPETKYEDADVEFVASELLPPKPAVPTRRTWGSAPELKIGKEPLVATRLLRKVAPLRDEPDEYDEDDDREEGEVWDEEDGPVEHVVLEERVPVQQTVTLTDDPTPDTRWLYAALDGTVYARQVERALENIRRTRTATLPGNVAPPRFIVDDNEEN